MDEILNRSLRYRTRSLVVLLALTGFGSPISAADLSQAEITRIIKDVQLLQEQAAPRPAAVKDVVRGGTAVHTGTDSRAELTFTDLTITRIGQNTVFSFKPGTRQINLESGAILLQVPRKGEPAQIRTAAITASISGGTGICSANKGYPTKWLVIEGIGKLCINKKLGARSDFDEFGDCVTVHAGEMAMELNGRLIPPTSIYLKLVYNTSLLLLDFPPLANDDLILQAIKLQEQLAGGLPLPPPPPQDILDITDQAISGFVAQNETPTPTPSATPSPTATPSATPSPTVTPSATPSPTASPSATPVPTPTKFGTPSVISSPNPYVIGSGTSITTDPSITTNGVTNFGKIYRGPTDDGPFTQWAYGSTSAFDNALNLDTEFFADPNHLPIAFFKFQSLLINGNPTIDTSNGPTHLGLIGVTGITTGSPGGTLTFTGIDQLYLGTVNGSINLTSAVSFQGFDVLAVYARGASSDLTINSPISNIGALELAAQRSLQLTNTGTMSLGEFKAHTGGGNLTVDVGGSLLTNGEVGFKAEVLPGGNVASGANIALNVGTDFMNTSTSDFTQVRVINEGSHIGTGGNISIDIGGNLVTSNAITGQTPLGGFSPGDFVVVVRNTNGQIDEGGNISLTVDGNVHVNGLSLSVQNNDQSGNPAGEIGMGGSISASVGNLVTDAYLDASIGNAGGTIGGTASIDLIALSFSIGDFLSEQIDNSNGGVINGDATISIGPPPSSRVEGGFSGIAVGGDAIFQILNNDGGDGGGNIFGNASINVSAFSLSANSLLAEIDSFGGVISGTPSIVMNISDTASVTTDATFNIDTSFPKEGDGESTIAPDGKVPPPEIDFNGGSYEVGGTFRSTISNDGIIAFNSADVSADVLKAGVFGTNGVINIGGSSGHTLSADTELKLYAPGSNGQINFTSDVTLGGDSSKILAANSVTIFDDVVVTVGGKSPVDVYVGFDGKFFNANYTGSGGNGSTTGTFDGAGANDPQPLPSAPPFDDGGGTERPTRGAIHINNTGDLLSLLNGATPGRDGTIAISGRNQFSGQANSNRTMTDDRSNRDRDDIRHKSRLLQPNGKAF